MPTFAEVLEAVEHLSTDERKKLLQIVERKKEEEIFKAVDEARKESKEGKTIALSSSDDVKSYFEKKM